MFAELVEISPDKARAILEYSEARFRNRPLNYRKMGNSIEAHAAAMKEGRWDCHNGETIKFSHDGVLIDGYHRLHAVVKAGVPVRFLCVYDVDKSAYETIDSGHMRTQADMLFTSGICEANPKTAVAGARRMLAFFKYGDTKNKRNSYFSIDDIKATIRRHPLILEAASKYHSKNYVISQANYVLVYCASKETSPEMHDEFFSGLKDGLNFSGKYDVRYLLREQLRNLRISIKNSVVDPYFEGGLAIKAWNIFYTGRKIKQLKFLSEENFPSFTGWHPIELCR